MSYRDVFSCVLHRKIASLPGVNTRGDSLYILDCKTRINHMVNTADKTPGTVAG